jgi:hypothetical protein
VLTAGVEDGRMRAGDDLDELAWFDSAEPLPPMAFEADERIIERYRAGNLSAIPVEDISSGGEKRIRNI